MSALDIPVGYAQRSRSRSAFEDFTIKVREPSYRTPWLRITRPSEICRDGMLIFQEYFPATCSQVPSPLLDVQGLSGGKPCPAHEHVPDVALPSGSGKDMVVELR